MTKRFKFFIKHLSASMILGGVSLLIIFLLWYTPPLHKALGVTDIIWMLVLVDVIIGPILGFVVYKEHKKSLKFDLMVIFLIQILAFLFGMHSIFEGRPKWIVYDESNFAVIKASDVEKNSHSTNYNQLNLLGPKYVALKSNIQGGINQSLMELIQNRSNDLTRYPAYYQDFDSSQLKSKGLPLYLLKNYNEANDVDRVLQKHPQANAWFALVASREDMVVLIDNKKGEIVKIVDLRPW